jgi:hypothetical protein
MERSLDPRSAESNHFHRFATAVGICGSQGSRLKRRSLGNFERQVEKEGRRRTSAAEEKSEASDEHVQRKVQEVVGSRLKTEVDPPKDSVRIFDLKLFSKVVRCEALRRKQQDALERDITAVKQKIFGHENDAVKLLRKYPKRADDINKNLRELKQSWDQLEALSVKRRQKRSVFSQMVKFAMGQQSTIPECVAQIELHVERKAEINGCDKVFKDLI